MSENKIIKDDIISFANSFDLYNHLKNKSILITGITGLIGSITAKCLNELNEKYDLNITIYGVVRDLEKAHKIFKDICGINFICIELDQINELLIKVDYIIHYACPTESKYFIEHPIDVYNIITKGTETVLNYANSIKASSVVYVSSIESYGIVSVDSGIIDEQYQGYIDPLSVRSSYSLGKRSAEFISYSYYAQYSTPVKIARLTQTFGAGVSWSDNRIFAQLAKSVILNNDIILHTMGLSSKSYCYTTDAVSAILYILVKGDDGNAYNVTNPDTYISVREMAEIVKTNFEPNINIKIEIDETKGYAPDTYLNLDITKLQKLGWSPKINLKTMYRRLIDYYKTNDYY